MLFDSRSDKWDIYASSDGNSEECILFFLKKEAKNEEMKLNIHLTRKSHNLNLNFGHTHSLPREQHAEIEKNKKFYIPKVV